MAEVNGAYKQDQYKKNLVEKFTCNNIKVFVMQDDQPASQLAVRPTSWSNTTHSIDPHDTHMDKELEAWFFFRT